MRMIDLSLELSNDLQVFPGDPRVEIQQLQTFNKDGWNMKRLHINGHDGTHINAQIHGMPKGKTLDNYKIADFIGKAVVYDKLSDIKLGIGIIIRNKNIDLEFAKVIARKKPKFIGLAAEFEMDVEVEKYFFKKNILCYEKIANTDKLPKSFVFYGVPLRIKDGDGSPVRAYAIVE